MPNPVAEVVERLLPCPFCGAEPHVSSRMDEDLATHNIVEWKSVGCIDCGISFEIPDGYEGGTAAEQWNTRAVSRERDTGVPEGWQAVPKEMTDEQIFAMARTDNGMFSEHFKKLYAAALSAAPQPPTVSPDVIALTRERDQAREALAKIDALEPQAEPSIDDNTDDTNIAFADGTHFGRWQAGEIARSVLHPEKEEKA